MAGRAFVPRVTFDRALLLVMPAALFMVLPFIYPFLYGLLLSFTPQEGGASPRAPGSSAPGAASCGA